jgi:hypothetical protein
MTDMSTRSDRPFLDIDYVEFTTGDDLNRFVKAMFCCIFYTDSRQLSTTLVDTTFDDDAAQVQYTTGWDSSPNNQSQFYFQNTMQ